MTIDSKIKNLTRRQLVVFDFDDTLVDCNSDTWIHQLAPNARIPDQLQYIHGQDYFKHVQSVLCYLHKQGVTEKDYVDCLSKMPAVDGMIDALVKKLSEKPDEYDMIILSDSNSFFISTYLESKSIDNLFCTVLTNPARFNQDGQLVTEEYHLQDYCSLSARNLCKGEALKNFIGKRMIEHNTVYTCVNYVGDGENDLCPSSKLSNRDRIFPRVGYTLDRLCARIKANQDFECINSDVKEGESKLSLRASVIPWSTGAEIYDVIDN